MDQFNVEKTSCLLSKTSTPTSHVGHFDAAIFNFTEHDEDDDDEEEEMGDPCPPPTLKAHYSSPPAVHKWSMPKKNTVSAQVIQTSATSLKIVKHVLPVEKVVKMDASPEPPSLTLEGAPEGVAMKEEVPSPREDGSDEGSDSPTDEESQTGAREEGGATEVTMSDPLPPSGDNTGGVNEKTSKEVKKKSKKRSRKQDRKSSLIRKNIRKILSEATLTEEVKEAQKAEAERLKRIEEKKNKEDNSYLMKILNQGSSELDDSHLDIAGFCPPPAPKQPRISAPSIPPFPHLPPPPTQETLPLPVPQTALFGFPSANLGPGSGRTLDDAICLDDSDDDNKHPVRASDSEDDTTTAEKQAVALPDEFGRVLINRSHPATEEDYFLPDRISATIKPHQIGGIRFLYDNVVESVVQYQTTPGLGCILAHSMGLGKTIQVVSFLDVLFRHVKATSALVIVPINTIQNWQSEIEMWLPEKPAVNGSSIPFSGFQEATNGSVSVPGDLSGDVPGPSDDPQDEKERAKRRREEEQRTGWRPFNLFVIKDNLKTVESRHQVIKSWHQKGGVLLIGYEMFRLLVVRRGSGKSKAGRRNQLPTFISMDGGDNSNSSSGPSGPPSVCKKPVVIDVEAEERKSAMFKDFYEALIDPGPQVVICDEGHRIKNSEASISKALKAIRTKRRVVMTGYPLQNNLLEYWCMVDFVRPNYLGSKVHFVNMFQRPIENGQCVDSTEEDRKLMQGRAHVLHDMLTGFVQRRSQAVLQASLPEKKEVVLLVRMSTTQRALYRALLSCIQTTGGIVPAEGWANSNTLKTYAVCCKIWNHPDILWRAVMKQSGSSLTDPFDFDIEDSASISSASNFKSAPSRSGRKKKSGIGTSTTGQPQTDSGISYEWTHSVPQFADYRPGIGDNGGKIPLLLSIVEKSILLGDKVLVFSQSLLSLDVLEIFLGKTPFPLGDTMGGPQQYWVKNETYYRLDGSTSASERERLIINFNRPDGHAKLFLLSTRAGCLGINLVGANRVIVLDASWNPCHDCQAVCRVYRYGQTKTSFIYRLVTDNTMEKKIYDRQVTKQSVSDRVLDEQNQFTRHQVNQLMEYIDKDLPSVTSEEVEKDQVCRNLEDPVLLDTLKQHAHWITTLPFTHESLLVDRKEYRLTRAEKQMAKMRYQHESRKGPHANYRPGYSDMGPGNFRPGYSDMAQMNRFDNNSMNGLSRTAYSTPSFHNLQREFPGDYPPSHTLSSHWMSNKLSDLLSYDLPPPPPLTSGSMPSGPPSLHPGYDLIKRINLDQDYMVTTGKMGPDGAPIRRRIRRGELVEIMRTPKGKSIHIPRTGEVFMMRNTSSSTSSSSLNALLASPSPAPSSSSRNLYSSPRTIKDLLFQDTFYPSTTSSFTKSALRRSVYQDMISRRTSSHYDGASSSNSQDDALFAALPAWSSRNSTLACCGCPQGSITASCPCVCHALGADFGISSLPDQARTNGAPNHLPHAPPNSSSTFDDLDLLDTLFSASNSAGFYADNNSPSSTSNDMNPPALSPPPSTSRYLNPPTQLPSLASAYMHGYQPSNHPADSSNSSWHNQYNHTDFSPRSSIQGHLQDASDITTSATDSMTSSLPQNSSKQPPVTSQEDMNSMFPINFDDDFDFPGF